MPVLVLRVIFVGMLFAASALSAGLAFLRNKDEEDGGAPGNEDEFGKAPVGDRPLHNVVSREEAFAAVRERIKKNPSLAEGMSNKHKKMLELD